MVETVTELLLGLGLPDAGVRASLVLILVSVVLGLSWAANLITRVLLLRVVWHLISRTDTDWDDALVKRGVFRRLARLAPALVIYLFAPAFGSFESWVARLALVYMIAMSVRVVESILDAGSDIYESHARAREAPIAGYVQVGKIALYLVGVIFLIATVLEREPWGLLTGLGAMSAVLLLVFRDSIMGLVASVQLSSYDMVHVGDWIEMPAYGADGDVIEVSLHTVKVQNWDKTISTIPTQSLISQSFKNWRGMEESGRAPYQTRPPHRHEHDRVLRRGPARALRALRVPEVLPGHKAEGDRRVQPSDVHRHVAADQRPQADQCRDLPRVHRGIPAAPLEDPQRHDPPGPAAHTNGEGATHRDLRVQQRPGLGEL